LSVKNEEQLSLLLKKAKFKELKHTVFREPDIGDEITAIALEPGDRAKKLTNRLPLALKEIQI